MISNAVIGMVCYASNSTDGWIRFKVMAITNIACYSLILDREILCIWTGLYYLYSLFSFTVRLKRETGALKSPKVSENSDLQYDVHEIRLPFTCLQ